MAKKIEKKEMTEKEQKIADLKAQLKEAKLEGSFKGAYTKLRKGTTEIMKNKQLDDEDKKVELQNLCESIIETLSE